jgi:hypothetical protein
MAQEGLAGTLSDLLIPFIRANAFLNERLGDYARLNGKIDKAQP